MTDIANPCILICDDSPEEIRGLVSMLKNADYRLAIAMNGREAVNRAGVLQPDIILMDIRMPEIDGLNACRILKAHPDTADIPVIFLTAANDSSDRIAGLKLGAVDYIVKPVCEEEVLLRIAIHAKTLAQPEMHVNPKAHQTQTAALVEACVRILEENLHLSPGTDELANRLGCSRKVLSAAFREVLGQTTYEWLRERRMQQAKRLLRDTQLPIHDIADELGFTTSNNFTTAFRIKFGMSPRDFRRTPEHERSPDEIKESGHKPTAHRIHAQVPGKPAHVVRAYGRKTSRNRDSRRASQR